MRKSTNNSCSQPGQLVVYIFYHNTSKQLRENYLTSIPLIYLVLIDFPLINPDYRQSF